MDIDNDSNDFERSSSNAVRSPYEPVAWVDGPASAQASIGFIMGLWCALVLQFAGLSLIGVTHPFDSPHDRTIAALTFLVHLAVFGCNWKNRPTFAGMYLLTSLVAGCVALAVTTLLSAGWN